MIVENANRTTQTATRYLPGLPSAVKKQKLVSDAPFSAPDSEAAPLPATQRITSAVSVQLTIVSKNTSKIAHCPWISSAAVSALPFKTARLPSPASFENTPRAIP